MQPKEIVVTEVHSQPKSHSSRKALAFFFCGLFLLLAALLLWAGKVKASHISYDPYADFVASSSAGVANADNAVGAPNDTMAQMVGANAILTLDMGSGEEGTQTLKVYYGQINALVNATVEFLDANKGVITTRSVQLEIDPNPSTKNFAYNWKDYGKAYRFVRLSSSQIGASVNVDAIEALGYIGSTPSQDTDGDGATDRDEQHNGTNPLVPDQPSGGGGSTPPPSSGGSGGSGGGSGEVNPIPPPNKDKDGDGIDDEWELKYGLNPNDKSDANADPDGDHLTNLGEYKYNTDPNKADDLYKVFATECNCKAITSHKMTGWDWLLIALLLLGALISWLAAITAGPMDPPDASSSAFYRLRYRLHQKL